MRHLHLPGQIFQSWYALPLFFSPNMIFIFSVSMETFLYRFHGGWMGMVSHVLKETAGGAGNAPWQHGDVRRGRSETPVHAGCM